MLLRATTSYVTEKLSNLSPVMEWIRMDILS